MFIMEATGMPEILQDLSWAISQLIYSLMPNVYAVFEYFAKEEFFSSTEIANFWNNLYILLSVLVLFAIGIKLLSSIVNPDVLDKGKGDNKKKSAKQSFIDAIVAVFLVVLVPIVFGILNDVQREVIESNFIPEYILGKSINISSEANVGQILAYETLSSFLRPCSDEDHPDRCDSEAGVLNMQMLSYSIKDINTIGNEQLSSKDWLDGAWTKNELDYQPILAPVAGGMILYQLVLMALDMALRAVKIAFLEIMTPIILGAYIFNRDIFTRWVKEFIATYIGAFLKIMIVTLLVIGLSKFDYINSSDFAKDTNFNNTTIGILKLVLIMGILRLVKEVPNLINKIFGTNIQPQGGIRGRLGQMAGVGNLAQRAWDTLRTHPIQTTRRLVSAPISAVGGAVSHGAAAFGRARGQWQNGQRGAAIRTGIGGFFGMGGAALRSGQQGWRNGNLQAIGQAYNRYGDTHPEHSTFLGRSADTITSGLGFGTSQSRFDERARYVTHNGQRMTMDQLNNMRSEQDVILQRRNAIRDAALDAITADDTNVSLNVAGIGSGSYQQLVHALEGMRNAAPKQRNNESDAHYQGRVQAFEQRMQQLEQALINERTNARDALMEYALQHGGSLANMAANVNYTVTDGNGNVRTVMLGSLDGSNQLNIPGRDIGITQTNYSSLNGMGLGPLGSFADLTGIATTAQNNLNDIDISLQTRQQEIYQDQNSAAGLARQANANATNARNNNNGGGNAGGGH